MKIKKPRVVLLTPMLDSATVELSDTDAPGGLLFRKKILPLDTISYPDPDAPGGTRRVSFDQGYHQKVIDAFKSHAIEAPTVQLADANNGHNMDLTRTAGEVVDVSHQQAGDEDGPGLYATIRARNAEHAKLLHEMPRLGVSAQIKENLRRVDGRKFGAALRHVLVTADPRVVGLGPWRAVSLSATDGPVIDLSDGDYEETHTMPKIKTDDGTLSLSNEEIEAALEAAAATHAAEQAAAAAAAGGDGRTVALSSGDQTAYLDLAERTESALVEIDGVKAQLAESNWKARRLELSNAGVPKILLDEAEKVLKFPGEDVLSLSDTDGQEFTEDARAVINSMLDACRGAIDLSDVDGSSDEPPLDLANSDDDKAFQDAWSARSGIA